jgi:hypothetical protein
MGKTCRDILLNPFCFVSYRFLNLYIGYYFFWYVMFSLFCMAFWPLYCVFETCKVKSVIKTLFRTIQFYISFYQISQPFPEEIIAKQKQFFNSKSGEKFIPLLRLYSKQKSRKITL